MSTGQSLNSLLTSLMTSAPLLLGAVACSDDAADTQSNAAVGDAGDAVSSQTRRIEISFEARVGSQPFDCEETYEVGTPASKIKPLDFKLYVQDVRLQNASGEETEVELEQDATWQNAGVALLDFENDSGSCSNGTSQVNTRIIGSVPRGSYQGLSFRIGVPEALNHANQATAPSPLNIESMFWSWLTGYKFLRIDVAPAHANMAMVQGTNTQGAGPGHGAGPMGFMVHLGSTMCSGDPMSSDGVNCQRENRPKASFPSFDAAKQNIVVDLAALLESSDVSRNGGGEPGCMSGPTDPDCKAVFEQLGLNHETGESSGAPAFLSVTSK